MQVLWKLVTLLREDGRAVDSVRSMHCIMNCLHRRLCPRNALVVITDEDRESIKDCIDGYCYYSAQTKGDIQHVSSQSVENSETGADPTLCIHTSAPMSNQGESLTLGADKDLEVDTSEGTTLLDNCYHTPDRVCIPSAVETGNGPEAVYICVHMRHRLADILRDGSFDTDRFTLFCFWCALVMYKSTPQITAILAVLEDFCKIPTVHIREVYIEFVNLFSLLFNPNEGLRLDMEDRLLHTVQLIAKMGLLHTGAYMKCVNSSTLPKSTLGISPALYFVLTSHNLSDYHCDSVFVRYPASEKNIYFAAAHLIRGISKYRCTFDGIRPRPMYLDAPSAIAVGCLHVLEKYLTDMEYMLALWAISVRHSIKGNSVRGECTMFSKDELMLKVNRHMQSPNRRGALAKMKRYLNRIGKGGNSDTRADLISTLGGHVVRAGVLSMEVQHVNVDGVHSNKMYFDEFFTLRLLMFLRNVPLTVHDHTCLVRFYWKCILYDKRWDKKSFTRCDKECLLSIQKCHMFTYPAETHLDILLDISGQVPLDIKIANFADKVVVACVSSQTTSESNKLVMRALRNHRRNSNPIIASTCGNLVQLIFHM